MTTMVVLLMAMVRMASAMLGGVVDDGDCDDDDGQSMYDGDTDEDDACASAIIHVVLVPFRLGAPYPR